MKCIVKRHGTCVKFDERKIYASCYSACISCCHLKPIEAEKICEKVTKEVKKWIKAKDEVTSTQIHKEVTKAMRKYHKEAAFMYDTHRDVN